MMIPTVSPGFSDGDGARPGLSTPTLVSGPPSPTLLSGSGFPGGSGCGLNPSQPPHSRGVGRSAMVPTGPRVLMSGVAWAVAAPRTSSAGAAIAAMTAPTPAVRTFVWVWVVAMVCSLLVATRVGQLSRVGALSPPPAHTFSGEI